MTLINVPHTEPMDVDVDFNKRRALKTAGTVPLVADIMVAVEPEVTLTSQPLDEMESEEEVAMDISPIIIQQEAHDSMIIDVAPERDDIRRYTNKTYAILWRCECG